MRTKIMAVILAVFMMAAIPTALGIGIGINTGTGITWNSTNSPPKVWMNPATRLFDASGLLDREGNYCFTGESIQWDVLVRDANGIEDVSEVGVTVGDLLEANCYTAVPQPVAGTVFNWAHDGTNFVTFDPIIDRMYKCQYTCEPSAHGQYWIVAEATDAQGGNGTFDEHEFWFINPTLALSLSGPINFGNIMPGQRGYSNSIWLKNNAETDSGVLLEMYISGTDFYDSTHSSARCPTGNVLLLSNLAYFATQGAYSTNTNAGVDGEGYDTIPYETGSLGDRDIIIDANPYLVQGSQMSLTFRLDMPRPCIGSFNSGEIYFWGEVA